MLIKRKSIEAQANTKAGPGPDKDKIKGGVRVIVAGKLSASPSAVFDIEEIGRAHV